MHFSRGDVVLVLFPDSNLRTAKRRPALIVQSDNLQTGLMHVVVDMISSNMARAGAPLPREGTVDFCGGTSNGVAR